MITESCSLKKSTIVYEVPSPSPPKKIRTTSSRKLYEKQKVDNAITNGNTCLRERQIGIDNNIKHKEMQFQSRQALRSEPASTSNIPSPALDYIKKQENVKLYQEKFENYVNLSCQRRKYKSK